MTPASPTPALPAASPVPLAGGPARPAPVVGGASNVPGLAAPAFAADLARLLATLAAGGTAGAADMPAHTPSGSPAGEGPADESAAVPGDALAVLSMQLDLIAEPSRPLPAPAQGIGDRVAALASAKPPVAPPAWLARAAEAMAGAAGPLPPMGMEPQPVADTAPLLPPGLALASPVAERAAASPVMPAVVPTVVPAVAPAIVPTVVPAVVPTIAPTVVDIRLPQAPQQIAETVVWHAAGNGGGEVRIHLNPKDLGPLDVHLKLDGDKVTVRFEAPDAGVRDVVQTSLPSLATLLSARGLQLDQAQVFSQGRGQQPMPQGQAGRNGPDDGGSESDASIEAPRVSARRGLVDDYV